MSKRNIDDINGLSQKGSQKGDTSLLADSLIDDSKKNTAKIRVVDEVIAEKKTVSLHYPKPIPLSILLNEVSVWSGYNFVLSPSLNKEMQIFAPRKMTPSEAFQLFVASLETIGLRALQMEGTIIKIVPMSLGSISV